MVLLEQMEHGKTTTIKTILGLQKLDSGEIFINGFNIKKDFEKAIQTVGAIVENPDFYLYLSGYDNLKLNANLYENVDDKRIQEVVSKVGLENRINEKVAHYSLGMKQRLGIARAILNRPSLIILDEPTNGLDPEGIIELRDLILKISQEDEISILISSHNLYEISACCSRVIIIKEGQIIGERTTEGIDVKSLEDIFMKEKKEKNDE